MTRRRPVVLFILDTVNLLLVFGPALLVAVLVPDSWPPRMVVFGLVAALLAIPVKRVLRAAFVRAGAADRELR